MFYKFNTMIGRITPSTQTEAYSPQGVAPLGRQRYLVTFDTKKNSPSHEPAAVNKTRPMSSAPQASAGNALGVVPSNPRYQKIMEMQNAFLKQDGKLVWQKMGGRDRAGYMITVGLVLVGTAFCVAQLYKMSFPKKTQD